MPWPKGRPLSAEMKDKISRSHAHIGGAAHGAWKGTSVGRRALHKWLDYHFPKTGVCEWCGDPSKDYANLSGEYRRDRADFAELCRPCHRTFDNAKRKESLAARS